MIRRSEQAAASWSGREYQRKLKGCGFAHHSCMLWLDRMEHVRMIDI